MFVVALAQLHRSSGYQYGCWLLTNAKVLHSSHLFISVRRGPQDNLTWSRCGSRATLCAPLV